MSEGMGGLMSFLREDREYSVTKLQLTEDEVEKVQRVLPENQPDDPEAVGMEDYSGQDMTKVKSQTPKNKRFAIRQVKDKEVETPIPAVKPPAKESRGTLFLCNECCKTFRTKKLLMTECTHCSSRKVERISLITEGVTELIGEIEGISMEDQVAVRKAVESGQIPDEWPTEDIMIDELSSLEDIVNPEEDLDVDVKLLYLKHVLVPKALSMREGKAPEGTDDEETMRKKLTEDEGKSPRESSWTHKVMAVVSKAAPQAKNTNVTTLYGASGQVTFFIPEDSGFSTKSVRIAAQKEGIHIRFQYADARKGGWRYKGYWYAEEGLQSEFDKRMGSLTSLSRGTEKSPPEEE